jgi:thioredoxin 1
MGAGFVRIVTDDSFERDVLGHDGLALVSFGASWCGPCRLLAPGLRSLASLEKDRLKVAKLDVDANPATPERYAVESYPTCILFRGGEPIERLDGYMPLRKIQAALQKHLDAH